MKHLILTQADQMQLFTLRMGLRMVAESNGRMHLTRPALVRRCALLWLGKAGFKVSNRTRWATLNEMFESTFGKVMDEIAAEAARRKDEEEGGGAVAALN